MSLVPTEPIVALGINLENCGLDFYQKRAKMEEVIPGFGPGRDVVICELEEDEIEALHNKILGFLAGRFPEYIIVSKYIDPGILNFLQSVALPLPHFNYYFIDE